MNKVILTGNVGKDPQVSSTGKTVYFSLATTRYYQVDGEWKDETQWHNVQAYGYVADKVSKRIHKGSKVMVEGEINYYKKSKDGVEYDACSIVAKNVEVFDPKQKTETTPANNTSKEPKQVNSYLTSVEKSVKENPEDIPF